MVRFRLCVASLLVLALPNVSLVRGGDGFPPFGAWVYGTGHVPAARVTRVRTVHRAHPVGWHGWGGYGNIGYASTTRIRYGGFHGHHWHHRPYVSYRVSYPSVFYYRPFPVYNYIPAYTYPVYTSPVLYAPTCAAPTVAVGFGLAGTTAQPNNNPVTTSLVRNSLKPKSSPDPIVLTSAAGQAKNTSTTSLVATVVGSTPGANNIPDKVLHVADTILRIGGYREAAQAYARLSNKYGTSDLIYGRRFVAQAAAGDMAQAEVILEMADASGFAIRPEELPNGSLGQLLDAPVMIASITERLAERALEETDDPLPLRSVATWLNLAGDPARASVFLRRAEQLEQVARAPKLNLNRATVLASFE